MCQSTKKRAATMHASRIWPVAWLCVDAGKVARVTCGWGRVQWAGEVLTVVQRCAGSEGAYACGREGIWWENCMGEKRGKFVWGKSRPPAFLRWAGDCGGGRRVHAQARCSKLVRVCECECACLPPETRAGEWEGVQVRQLQSGLRERKECRPLGDSQLGLGWLGWLGWCGRSS